MAVPSPPPLVTVVCATFNSSAILKLALRSLLDQDLSDFEAWVVGDACTDDSEEVVASFQDSGRTGRTWRATPAVRRRPTTKDCIAREAAISHTWDTTISGSHGTCQDW